MTPRQWKIVRVTIGWIVFLVLAVLFILDLSFTPDQKFGNRSACRIVGDHEYVTGRCIPYCPPRPSECG